MLKIMLVAVSFFGLSVASADVALYCGGLDTEGAFLKVSPSAKTMCYNGGQWRPDYCEGSANNFEIVQVRKGTLSFSNKDFAFTEYVGVDKKNNDQQLVRVFEASSNVSIPEISVHRADLSGFITKFSLKAPNVEAQTGESTCIAVDDLNF